MTFGRALMLVLFAMSIAACGSSATIVDDATNTADVSTQPSDVEVPGTAKVGDKIRLGDSEFFTAKKVIRWPGQQFLKPEPGNQFVAVLVEIEGIDADGASYNPFYFSVKDPDGFEYNFNAFGKEPQLQSGNQLAPGDKVTGWVTFEVPKKAKRLTLVYSPDVFGLDEPARVKFAAP
jgi:hypothetical protein